MLEHERRQRNQLRLLELYPYVRTRMEAVVREMEAAGYRPRIQEAWRSEADQLRAYQAGTTRIKYGFHNVTGPNAEKQAMAADIIDDNRPFNAKTDFMLRLAAAAQRQGLITGIRWDLSEAKAKAIDDAIAAQTWTVPVQVGWDPLHVEVTGLTPAEAQVGRRPDLQNVPDPTENTEETPVEIPNRRFKVEELPTGAAVEYKLGNALRPVTLLPVPYVSQLGAEADAHSNDCGAACAVMLMRAYQKSSITPNEFYAQFNIPGDPFLSVNQIRSALNSVGILTDFRAGLSIPDLFNLVASGKPPIVLIRYKVLYEAGLTEKPFQGPHFSVVVGVDPKYIYVHDPFYTDPRAGEAHAYPLEAFWQAWKTVAEDPSFPNPERSALIPIMGIGFRVNRIVKVATASLNVRSGPALTADVVGSVKMGDLLPVSREVNGWGEIGTNRWVKLSYTIAHR